MAITVGKTSKLSGNKLVAVAALEALSTDGLALPYSADDGKIVILVENSADAAAEVTVKAGNGLQGTRDYTVSVAAKSTFYGVFESGAYVNSSGPQAGQLVICGPATVKAGALALPF